MPVTNRQISKLFKLGATLLELHDDNPFKPRAYENAAFAVRAVETPLAQMSEAELEAVPGIGKNLSKKINQISDTGSYDELDRLLEMTPPGIIDLLKIKGLGGKKIKSLWEAIGTDSPEALLQACLDNWLVDVKGFGKKTQDNIIELIHFYHESKNKYLYADAEGDMFEVIKYLENHPAVTRVEPTGEMRRKMPFVNTMDFLIQLEFGERILDLLEEAEDEGILAADEDGNFKTPFMDIPVNFYEAGDYNWAEQLMRTSAALKHLELLKPESLAGAKTEAEIYEKNGLPYIIPEMREGRDEFEQMKITRLEDIIKLEDIKGCLHNHSTYSDGANTLEQMAQYCKNMGLEYFGISDHSKTAVYANGLKPPQVLAQIKEIDKLNEKLAPFKIFKGIESDILNDGALDYDESILKQLDFVVASIHSNLKMKEADANKRLLKAIENPYTTILGHMTSRQLLIRAGYPVNHKLIIDACAANNVVIEINASPKRLDMDWTWYSYALQKGIIFSINPDAHETAELHNMYFGVCVARKGGVTNNRVLNAFDLAEIESFFNQKKAGII